MVEVDADELADAISEGVAEVADEMGLSEEEAAATAEIVAGAVG